MAILSTLIVLLERSNRRTPALFLAMCLSGWRLEIPLLDRFSDSIVLQCVSISLPIALQNWTLAHPCGIVGTLARLASASSPLRSRRFSAAFQRGA